MTPVAPRIVNDVSYVTRIRINDARHFSWQAQHLLILECHFSWQAQYSVKFEYIDSRSAKCCNFQYKMCLRSAKSNLGERAGAR